MSSDDEEETIIKKRNNQGQKIRNNKREIKIEMNFWKYLRELLEVMFPEWQDQFIAYKDLKKQIKLTYPNIDDQGRPNKRPRLSDDDVQHFDIMREDFLNRLNGETEKINGFFMDKEEKFIIELTLLKAEVDSVGDTRQELMKLGSKMVDIHGEMILLKNYSALNYLGLLKILKKYDRRSGDNILLPFITKVQKQPFFRTEVINCLVEDCEVLICRVFSLYEQLIAAENEFGEAPNEVGGRGSVESQYVRLSRSALQTLRQIRSRSSTINMFSLPPMEV